MNNVTIITDSSSDLSLELMEDYNIKFASMTVDINNKSYKDKTELSNTDFYEMIQVKNTYPKTAQIPPYVFEEMFEKELEEGNEVICITISSKFSGTYNSAQIARNNLDGSKITIIDSETVALGLGNLVYEAAKKAREGFPRRHIISHINDLISKQDAIVMIDNMEMLKRGGRISGTKATIGSILGIKPLLTLKNGALENVGKSKGMKSALRDMIKYLKEKNFDENYKICIAHGNDIVNCNKIIDILSSDLNLSNLMISEIGPSVGTHAGVGALAIFFIKK